MVSFYLNLVNLVIPVFLVNLLILQDVVILLNLVILMKKKWTQVFLVDPPTPKIDNDHFFFFFFFWRLLDNLLQFVTFSFLEK